MLPFSQTQFFDVFETYNRAIWPVQIAAYVVAAIALWSALSRRDSAVRVGVMALALLWAWTGAIYHIGYFARINQAAWLFGLLFLVQAALLAVAAVRRDFAFAWRGPQATAAWALIAYAVALYPLLNAQLGHAYPRAPSFGVTPCPLTIFTFGFLLLSRDRVPWWLLAAPAVWSLIGGSAAVLLDVPADLALPVAAAVAVTLNMRKPVIPGNGA